MTRTFVPSDYALLAPHEFVIEDLDAAGHHELADDIHHGRARMAFAGEFHPPEMHPFTLGDAQMEAVHADHGPQIAKFLAHLDALEGYRKDVPDPMNAVIRTAPVFETPMDFGAQLARTDEVARYILTEMATEEFRSGNPMNIPEPVVAWLGLTQAASLAMLEACEHADAPIVAARLAATLRTMRRHNEVFLNAAVERVETILAARRPIIAKLRGDGYDTTYEGSLP